MNDRRLDLDLDWKDVAEAAGIAVQTLDAVRKGRNEPTAKTKRGIERALRWEKGSVAVISAGGAPTPLDKPAPTKPPRSLEDVAALAENALAETARMRATVEALTQSLRDIVGDEKVDRIIEQTSENPKRTAR